jgi:hypothetical protein
MRGASQENVLCGSTSILQKILPGGVSKNSKAHRTVFDELSMVGDLGNLAFQVRVRYRAKKPGLNIDCSWRQSCAIQYVLDDFLRNRLGLELSDAPSLLDYSSEFIHENPPEKKCKTVILCQVLELRLTQVTRSVKNDALEWLVD